MVLQVVFYSWNTSAITDENPTSQWKYDKRLRRPLREVTKKFRDEMNKLHEDTTTQQQNNTRRNVPLPSESLPPNASRNVLSPSW